MSFADETLRAAAERFGTPLYLYDFDLLECRARALAAALPEPCRLCFAVKANPARAVVAALARLGLGADVASRGELRLARAAGMAAERIVVSGPAKSDADLAAAVGEGVLGVNVEGPRELERLAALAARRGVVVPVQLRLAVPWSAGETTAILGGGGPTQFGMDLELAERLLAERRRFPALEVRGFHVFNASNVRSAGAWVAQAARVVELSAALAARHGLTLGTIDVGGGLGIPYRPRERELDLSTLERGLTALGRRLRREPRLRRARLIVEPGRYLAGPMGVYVARVLEVKRTAGRDFALLDGGVHHLLRPALIGAPHPARLVRGDGSPAAGRPETVALAGPLCTSLDLLAPAARLPRARPGDLVVFSQAGAYGYSESMPLFLSHPWAAEVGLRRGRMWRLRRPPSPDRLIAQQDAPEDLVATGGAAVAW